MKQLIAILTLFMLAALPMPAQENLQINQLFSNKTQPDRDFKRGSRSAASEYVKDNRVVKEVVVQGRELKPYDLTLFRSVTFDNGEQMAKQIEEWIEADSREAYDKEVGRIQGRLYYGFFCLPAHKGKLRYLFYRNAALQPNGNDKSLSVVYMEGNATLEQLKEMFK